jgi:hypothetical protein
MMLKRWTAIALAAIALGGAVAPAQSFAQDWRDLASKHRQGKKNEWRNIGIGSAALGLLGLLKGDSTLMFAGTAGALYSAHRYEQDRKSQSKIDRARATMFGRREFTRDGRRYVRKTVYKNGKKYYRFVRA